MVIPSKTFVGTVWRMVKIDKLTGNAIVLIAASLIMCVWIGVFVFDQMAQKEFRDDAAQDTTNIARVFGEHVARAIKETDKTLLMLRAIQEDRPDEFNLTQWVGHKEFKSELVVQYAQISATGMMMQSNVGSASKTVNLSDREHFTVHINGLDDKLFISKPVMGRASGKWSIQLSRRLRQPDGSFGGVIVGSIDPEFLAHFYDGIYLGLNGAKILVGSDGVVRARAGGGDLALNQSIVSSSIFAVLSSAEAGVVTAPDPIDNEFRLFSFRAVSGYPLVVLAGISDKEILMKGRLRYDFSIGVGTLLTVLVGLLCATLHLKFRLNSKVALLSLERDKSEAANSAKSSFLAMMSHEIRTPMNAIIGLSSTLMKRSLQAPDQNLVRLINQEGDRLLVLLNDILDYSMMESGKLHFENIAFEPTEIMSGVLAIASPSGLAKGLTLGQEFGAELPMCLIGDSGRLQQVLLNLVSNSIKFTKKGSVITKVECLEQGDGFAVIQWSVHDTGIGIAPENIGKLFNNFVQADVSINRSFGGSGLGLAICKRIICQMGGTIKIESVPEVQTTVSFVVKLPIGQAQPVHDAQASYSKDLFTKHASPGETALRLLLVDDSQVNLLVASEMLSDFELSIETAMNGVEAVAAANQGRYDLILMDMLMPEMDGIQATRAIRTQSGPSADVPIIAVTANAFAEDIKTCEDAGMDGFITKPIRKSVMLDEMIRVLTAAGSDKLKQSETVEIAVDTKLNKRDLDGAPNFNPEPLRTLSEALGRRRTDEAVRLFIAETSARIFRLKELSNQGNSAVVSREARSIRESSATFGLMGLSAVADNLEKAPATATQEDLKIFVAAIDLSFHHGCLLIATNELSTA
jgi:two-component system, sensor histidine kinase